MENAFKFTQISDNGDDKRVVIVPFDKVVAVSIEEGAVLSYRIYIGSSKDAFVLSNENESPEFQLGAFKSWIERS